MKGLSKLHVILFNHLMTAQILLVMLTTHSEELYYYGVIPH